MSMHVELANETRNDIQVIEGMIEVRAAAWPRSAADSLAEHGRSRRR